MVRENPGGQDGRAEGRDGRNTRAGLYTGHGNTDEQRMEQADRRKQQTASGKLRDGSRLGDLQPLPEADEIWGQRGVNLGSLLGCVSTVSTGSEDPACPSYKPQQSQSVF